MPYGDNLPQMVVPTNREKRVVFTQIPASSREDSFEAVEPYIRAIHSNPKVGDYVDMK
jgi:ribosomal protein L7Ae-like RNA K-turn-binding protein